MTLNKYNEVMENVKVSDEMRQRILQNIEKEVGSTENAADNNVSGNNISEFKSEKKTKGNNIVRFVKQYGSMVAIFAILVLGTYGVIRTVGLNGSKGEMAATSSEQAAADTAYMEEATESAEATEEAYAEESYAEATESAAMDEEASATYDDFDMADAMPEPGAIGAGKSDEESVKNDNSIGSFENKTIDSDSSKESGEEKTTAENGLTGSRLASSEELSKKLGFEIDDIESLKNKAVSTDYYLYDDGGEIKYITADDEISYCASSKGSFVGGRDVDLTDFSTSKTLESGEIRALAYGNDDVFELAYWEENGIWYSIISDKGMSEEEMLEIIGK